MAGECTETNDLPGFFNTQMSKKCPPKYGLRKGNEFNSSQPPEANCRRCSYVVCILSYQGNSSLAVIELFSAYIGPFAVWQYKCYLAQKLLTGVLISALEPQEETLDGHLAKRIDLLHVIIWCCTNQLHFL